MPHTRVLLLQPAHHTPKKVISSAATAGWWQGSATASMACLDQALSHSISPSSTSSAPGWCSHITELNRSTWRNVCLSTAVGNTLKFWSLPVVSELCFEVSTYTLASGQLNFYISIKILISSLLLIAESTPFTSHLWPYALCLGVGSLFILLFSFLGKATQLLLEDLCMETALTIVPCSLKRSHEILCLFLRTVEKKSHQLILAFQRLITQWKHIPINQLRQDVNTFY